MEDPFRAEIGVVAIEIGEVSNGNWKRVWRDDHRVAFDAAFGSADVAQVYRNCIVGSRQRRPSRLR